MAHYEKILVVVAFCEKLLKILQGGLGSKRFGQENLGFIARFVAYERGCLQAALEWAGDDEVELNLQRIEHMGKVEAVAFAIFVQWALDVENWIAAPDACARMSKDE